MTQDQWGSIRNELHQTMGANSFQSWIEPLIYVGTDGGIARFNVPTNFLGNYVSQNYGDMLLSKITRMNPSVRRIVFDTVTVSQDAPAQRKEAADATGAPLAVPQVHTKSSAKPDSLNGSPLDKRFTFDTFVVGKPNELAHAAARRVAEGGPVTFNPLFLYGGVGLGKTHLMHAIAWELRTRHPHLNVLNLSAEQFMYRFVQALRDRKMMDFKELFRSVDVLMVDDVQFIAGKDSTQEELLPHVQRTCGPAQTKSLSLPIALRTRSRILKPYPFAVAKRACGGSAPHRLRTATWHSTVEIRNVLAHVSGTRSGTRNPRISGSPDRQQCAHP